MVEIHYSQLRNRFSSFATHVDTPLPIFHASFELQAGKTARDFAWLGAEESHAVVVILLDVSPEEVEQLVK